MKEIININLGCGSHNYTKELTLFDHKFRVTHYGCDYDIDLACALAEEFDGHCDAIAVSGLPNSLKLDGTRYDHQHYKDIRSRIKFTPMVDGQNLRELYIPWAIKKMAKQNKDFFQEKKIGFFCGIVQYNYLESFNALSSDFSFADPYFIFKTPYLLRTQKRLKGYLKRAVAIMGRTSIKTMVERPFNKSDLQKKRMLRSFIDCDIFVSNSTQLEYINTDLFKGKTLILDNAPAELKKKLHEQGVKHLISFAPEGQGINECGLTIAAAAMRTLKVENTPLCFDEVLSYIEKYELFPEIPQFDSDRTYKKKFAFLVHPLKKTDLFKIKPLRQMRKIKSLVNVVERISPHVPGFFLGKIMGIESSASNYSVEGEIYAVPETPKMLLRADADRFYRKVKKITNRAKSRGNHIFGLGAYTKIVGDAGVTISQQSLIPVTTGNSLSAASTIWAANYAIKKMGLVEIKDKVNQGTVMVIGATGSIGKVTAKLLCNKWQEVILIAPRYHKLMELNEEISKLAPNANIIYSNSAGKFLSKADLLVTTTSNQGGKILDIDKVKPGAVICDVSRPFDITFEDARKRPDVLVIASGEVELPGKVKLTCDLGLHGSVVYACLAETALLALEGKMECFSLSRDLDYLKVREIDRLARKHDVKLAAIMGHENEITDDDIYLCRKHALGESI